MARAKGIPALELYRLAQKKKRKLVLCGHSLGGAVSWFCLFTCYLCSSFVFVFVCLFFKCFNTLYAHFYMLFTMLKAVL